MKTPLKHIVIIFALLLPPMIRADDQALKLCDLALNACEERVHAVDELLAKEQELRRKITEQRDSAIAKLDSQQSVPWYIWVLGGVATGVIITRGLR